LCADMWVSTRAMRPLAAIYSFEANAPAEPLPLEGFSTKACAAQGWQLFRHGPFVSTGGYSWMGAIYMLDEEALGPYATLSDGDHVHAFESYAIGNVDATGALVGYPPIHQHHFHLFGSANAGMMLSNNHGDSQCSEAEGGVSCYVKSAPTGTAYFFRSRLGAISEFNDVRSNGSEPLSTFVLVALKPVRTRQPLRQLREFDASIVLVTDRSFTYSVYTHAEAVTWHASRFHGFELSQVVEAYVHTHAPMLNDLMVWQGTPEMVFADVAAASASRNGLLYGESVIADTLRSLRDRQRDVSRGPAAHLACSYLEASTVEWVLDKKGQTWDAYQRKARCQLDPAGPKDFVVIALHARMWEPLTAHGTPDTFPIHAAMRVYFAEQPGKLVLRPDVGMSDANQARWVTERVHIPNLMRYPSFMFDFFKLGVAALLSADSVSEDVKDAAGIMTNSGGEILGIDSEGVVSSRRRG